MSASALALLLTLSCSAQTVDITGLIGTNEKSVRRAGEGGPHRPGQKSLEEPNFPVVAKYVGEIIDVARQLPAVAIHETDHEFQDLARQAEKRAQ